MDSFFDSIEVIKTRVFAQKKRCFEVILPFSKHLMQLFFLLSGKVYARLFSSPYKRDIQT